MTVIKALSKISCTTTKNSMKRRWSFDDGIFNAMCKWAFDDIFSAIWMRNSRVIDLEREHKEKEEERRREGGWKEEVYRAKKAFSFLLPDPDTHTSPYSIVMTTSNLSLLNIPFVSTWKASLWETFFPNLEEKWSKQREESSSSSSSSLTFLFVAFSSFLPSFSLLCVSHSRLLLRTSFHISTCCKTYLFGGIEFSEGRLLLFYASDQS